MAHFIIFFPNNLVFYQPGINAIEIINNKEKIMVTIIPSIFAVLFIFANIEEFVLEKFV